MLFIMLIRNFACKMFDVETRWRLKMTEIQQRWQVVSGSGLKLLAVITMLIDHLSFFVLRIYPAMWEPLLTIGHRQLTPCLLMQIVGRLAFPIFAFLIVEGYQHTHDRWRYGRNLLVFALLSEIPWNLVHTGTWHCSVQNVFFTLFLGYLGICVIESQRLDLQRRALALLGLLVTSIVLRADYGCSGFGFILMLHMLRGSRLLQAVIGSCMLGSRWLAGLAFIPISMYNGRRGFIQGNLWKYAFYAFYPVHLLVIYLIQRSLFL